MSDATLPVGADASNNKKGDTMMEDTSKCDRCGEVALDLDMGFSAATLGLMHGGCGGAWQATRTDLEPASGARRPAQREGGR